MERPRHHGGLYGHGRPSRVRDGAPCPNPGPQSIYTLATTAPGAFSTLYPALVIALANAAPWITHLGPAAAAKLVQLLARVAAAPVLLADESHPRLVFFTLEALNAVLHHHPAENPALVYALLQGRATLARLGSFTLAGGLREVRAMRAAQLEQDARAAAGPGPGSRKGKDRAGGEGEGESAVEEKARLLAEEGRRSADLEAGQATTSAAGPLEKPRGASKERGESADAASTMERALAADIGRNGFVPTQEWVSCGYHLRRAAGELTYYLFCGA